MGLVSKVTLAETIDARVAEISQEIAASSPVAITKAKQLMTASRIEALTTAMPLEVQAQVDLVTSGELDRYRSHR